MLKPDTYYTIQCSSEQAIFATPDNNKNFLTQFNEQLSPLCGLIAFSILPKELHLLVKTTDEVSWEKYLRSQQLLNKDYQVFEEAGGMMLMGTLVQNKIAGFHKAFESTFKARITAVAEEELPQTLVSIHLQPVKQQLCPAPGEWVFSSYNAFLSDKPTRLPREEILQLFEGTAGFANLHQF